MPDSPASNPSTPSGPTDIAALLSRNETLGAMFAEYERMIHTAMRQHETMHDKLKGMTEELEHKNRLLARQERLAALGEMAAGVAHEIRNPLGGISLYLELLANDVKGNTSAEALCAKIGTAVSRLNRIVEQILGFTRPMEPQMRETGVAALLDEAAAMTSADAGAKTVRIVRLACESTPVVRCDPELVHQLLLNFVRNAVEASPEGGTVELSAAVGVVGSGAAGVTLCVADRGHGLPDKATAKLFVPFFTTKKGGTGLGLALSQRIAEAHGGSVAASNRPGGGAMFTVTLPA